MFLLADTKNVVPNNIWVTYKSMIIYTWNTLLVHVYLTLENTASRFSVSQSANSWICRTLYIDLEESNCFLLVLIINQDEVMRWSAHRLLYEFVPITIAICVGVYYGLSYALLRGLHALAIDYTLVWTIFSTLLTCTSCPVKSDYY